MGQGGTRAPGSGGTGAGEPDAGEGTDAGEGGGSSGGPSDGEGGRGAEGGFDAGGEDPGAPGGMPGSAGTSDAGAGGEGECLPACPSARPLCIQGACVACIEDERRCGLDGPELCVDGAWIAQEPCPPLAPACTNGVCAVARVAGGLVTVRQESGAGAVRATEHGFEFRPRSCAAIAGGTVCVTGGLRP